MDMNRKPPGPSATHRTATPDSVRNEAEGIGTLFAGLLKDLQDLVRAEVQLAKTEIKEEATTAGRGIGFIVGVALIGLIGFVFLMLGLMFFLDRWLPLWVSALVVAALLVVVTAILVSSGRNQLSAANLVPEQTIATLKEDQEWAKQQMSSVKK